MPRERRLALLRLAALGTVLLTTLVVLSATGSLPAPEEVRDWGDGLGPAAPVLFAPLFAVVNYVIPWPILAGAAGLLFGTAAGTAVALAGVTLAALLQMATSRYFAGEQRAQLLPARVRAIEGMLERRGTVAVMYARIVPGLVYGAVNFLAGVTRLRFAQMALGTVVGAAPKVFGYTALGGSLDDLSKPEAKIAIGLMLVLAAAGLVVLRRELKARRLGLTSDE